MEITKELLHKLFKYKDGELFWKIKKNRNIIVGEKAGTLLKDGYVRTKINKKPYLNHRLIFLMFKGYLPDYLDHIDGNPSNNKICNLREATLSQNMHNQKLRKDNTSGIKGVSFHKKSMKWKVEVKVENKSMYFGVYSDKELAALVVEEARNKYHGNYANHGKRDEKVST